ncbi:hypothetical protein H0W26_02415 [Candidatus Dependentiae bacterium]|nr:hypothetical protein [Candidatus Dependentiae bacterium]
MRIIYDSISIEELKKMAEKMFGNLVKAVVDIEKGIIVVDLDMHADAEAFLLEQGSQQKDLWGINIYPHVADEDWIEFDSIINIRPSFGNRSRGVDDIEIQARIRAIIVTLVKR